MRLRSSSRLRRRSLSVGVAMLAALVVPSHAAADRARATTLEWRGCGDGLQCATASLPRDYARPNGKRVRLAVARFPAEDRSRRIGSLFVNPGGPGLSGIAFVREIVQQLHGDLSVLGLQRFDIVGFDPRGVGKSSPAIDCRVNQETQGPAAQPFKRPHDGGARTLVRRDRHYIRRCIRRNESILPYVSTANVARDMNRLRAAVGDAKLTYFGGSYGTFLGATYESMFPNRVRAMVLDGAVDPNQYVNHPLNQWEESTAAFERELGRFLQACARDQVACSGFGGEDPWAELDRLLSRLDRGPIPAGGPDPRPVDGDDARYAIMNEGLYSKYKWPKLAAALAQADHGDGTLLRELADDSYGWQPGGRYPPFEDQSFAISALERRYPQKPRAYWREGRRSYRDFPHFWWWGGYSKLVDGLYPIRPRGVFRGPFRNPASNTATLVIGTTYDPATPYRQAKRMVSELGNARLLTMNGDGHTAWASGSRCIDSSVAAYLNRLKLPAKGKACRQHVPFAARRAAQTPPAVITRP